MSNISETNTQNLQADVVVIGGGGAGLPAAVAAAEAGAKNIVILEKTAKPGGNANESGGVFAAESPAQKRLGINVTADKLFKDKMEEAEWKLDPVIIREFIKKSGKMLQWLEDKGLEINYVIMQSIKPVSEEEMPPLFHLFQPPTVAGFHSTFLGPKIIETLVKECQTLGIQLLCNTTARRILTDSQGTVRGIIAESNGKEIQMAARSVIIAAGGFGGSPDMIEKYFPTHGKIYSNSLPQMTGDGILMAAEAGAMADDELGIALIGPHHYPLAMSLNLLVRRPHVILVNKNGERYIDESAYSGGNNALNRQPDKVCYALLDSDSIRDMIQKRETVSSGENEMGDGGNWLDNLENDFRKESAEGFTRVADSWDEIAEYIGAQPEVLKATIDRYNTFCDQGYDADFLKDREYLLPLRTPPFYAISGWQGIDTTMGGIKINNRMEVLNKQASPISGLYAAGDNAAGCLSVAYKYGGSALAFALYSGYVAGGNAAKYTSGQA